MLEADYVFESGDDAMSRLQEKYDRLVVRYASLADAMVTRLKDEKDRKVYLIDKYQRENNEITTEIEGFKNTKLRDLEEE